MRHRADVATGLVPLGPLAGVVGVDDDPVSAARLRRHHRRLGAVDELARVARMLWPVRNADGERDVAGGVDGTRLETLGEPAREAERVTRVA